MLARRIAFPDFLDRGGAWWAGGYGCEVAWDAAMLIDLAVLNEAMSSPARKTTKEIAGLFTRSLRRFAADFIISSDRRNAVALRDAVRLWGRQQYHSPKDVLPTVLHKNGNKNHLHTSMAASVCHHRTSEQPNGPWRRR